MTTTTKESTAQLHIAQPINYHILTVKALGATNTNPARIKIISERFECSVIIPFTNEPGASNPAIDSATLWLNEKGFKIVGKGEGKDHYYLISTTFESLKTSKE